MWSWTSRTTSAQWAARFGHTTVIGAAGAIYVIGGWNGGDTYYNDVWVSTDRGADHVYSRRGVLGVLWVLEVYDIGVAYWDFGVLWG
jgi:hypothetical protein